MNVNVLSEHFVYPMLTNFSIFAFGTSTELISSLFGMPR